MFHKPLLALIAVHFAWSASAAITRDNAVFLLPLECSELLPDNGPFLNFFEAVARGNLKTDSKLARRLFRVLALRDRVEQNATQSRAENPVDLLIRKTLCFFRENKEPLKMVPYDDSAFLAFLRESIADLEKKVEEAIFQQEYDRHQRREYERLLGRNQALEEKLRSQAEVDADRKFERLSGAAKKKARIAR